jgi:hypothetical protein
MKNEALDIEKEYFTDGKNIYWKELRSNRG